MKTYETFEQAKEAYNALNETKYTVTCCFEDNAEILAEELDALGVHIICNERDVYDSVIFYVTPSILKVGGDLIEEWQENAIYVDVY